jgi:SAM-dependent methyltransferase
MNISSQSFWKKRIEDALEMKEIHRSVYWIDISVWEDIQQKHRDVLVKLFPKQRMTKLLDVGCGYGALLDALPEAPIDYTGIDISPDLLKIAKEYYPANNFIDGDFCALPFEDHTFNMAICRSIEGVVKENLGFSVWRNAEREILRVCDVLVLLNYTDPTSYRISEAVRSPEEFNCNRIISEHGYLVYRPGQDGSCEIYDLFVEPDHRRKGVASKMVTKLLCNTFGTVFGFTRHENREACAFYAAVGFQLIGIPNFYRGSDGVLFARQRLLGDPLDMEIA